MRELGRMILGFGVVMVILGGILLLVGNLSGKVPWLGRLPGDIYVEHEHWKLYVPLGTSILISIVVSIVLMLLFALFGRR
jgi:Protein of unknown function (DUF2905)